jgi:geranylgeranyl reductase family protein
MTDAEVIVVGGGPAGAATATSLAAEGLHVLVLDRAAFPRDKACAEFLSPGAVAALERLGVLEDAAAAGAWQEGMRIASDRASFTARYADGRRGLGIARPVLDRLLLERARAAGAEVRERTDVGGALVERGVVTGVRLRGGGTLRARFVVAADGLRSPVARSLGLERRPRWPRRLGLVARVRGAPPSGLGVMAVGRGAYCGVAAVGGGEASVGVAVSPGTRRPGEPAEELFERILASIAPARDAVADAPRVTAIRGVAPLARRVSRVSGPGYLLVGDAAGFTDPFTGEGIHRALRGAELASAAVGRALARPDREPAGYAEARREAFAAKERACLVLQAALARPALFDYCLRRAETRERVARVLTGVFGDYVPAETALRPVLVAELVRP